MIARPDHDGNLEESRRVALYARRPGKVAEPKAEVIHSRQIHQGPSVSEALQQVAHEERNTRTDRLVMWPSSPPGDKLDVRFGE
jgi:hypothetical protein